MSVVVLPDSPGPVSQEWRLLDFGTRLQPPTGGPVQILNRFGARYQVQVALPPMTGELAAQWIAALTKGVRDGVRWKLRQVGLELGLPGAPLVAGAGQAGFTLNIDNVTPNVAIGDGRMIAIITGGQRYVYMTASPVNASNTGTAALSLVSPLRVPPADNDVVEIGAPSIEGVLEEGGFGWSINAARHYGLAFSITEFG